MREEITSPRGSPDSSSSLEDPPLGLATCEGDQVRQAEAVGQDDEFMSSRSGLDVNKPVYRYSSTARMQLLLV